MKKHHLSWFYSVSIFLIISISGCESVASKDEVAAPAEFVVSLECDPVHPRAIIARINWVSDKARMADRRIEATVHKNGFVKKRYISLPIAVQTDKQQSKKASADKPYPALDLRIENVKYLKNARRHEVVVAGLIPGINYFWRVVPSIAGKEVSSVLRTRAPICPADMIDNREGEIK